MVDTVDIPRRPKRQQLASALGISRQMVHKLEQQGMSTESVDAALAWRAANLRGHMTKGNRITDVAPADAAVNRVHGLWPVALAALEANRFELVEAEMRAALRAVPAGARSRVQIDAEVMDRLTQHAYELIALEGEPAEAVEPAAMTDAETDAMGAFWYSVAAGEPIDWTEFE